MKRRKTKPSRGTEQAAAIVPDATPALRVIECAGCGAGLPVALGEPRVRCVFCGAERPVPELGEAEGLTAQAASAEREGLEALREAYTQRLQPTSTQRVVTGMACFIAPMSAINVLALVLYTAGIGGQAVFPIAAYATLGVGALGFYLSTRWLQRSAARQAEQLTRRVQAALSGEAQPARCPSCAGNVQAPDRAAALSCPFCRSRLLASHGMLVRWAESAEERRLAWVAQADELLDRVRARELRSARRAPVVGSLAVMGLAAASGGVTMATLSRLSLTQLEIDCRGRCRVDGADCLPGGTIRIYLAPGEAKVVQLWVAPGKWRVEQLTVPRGERRVFVCPPTPAAPR